MTKFLNHLLFDVYHSQCKNYFPNIDVCIEYRVTILFNFSDVELEEISELFRKLQNEFMYEGCKFYWHKKSKMAHIYKSKKNENYMSNRLGTLNLFKNTLELFYKDLECQH